MLVYVLYSFTFEWNVCLLTSALPRTVWKLKARVNHCDLHHRMPLKQDVCLHSSPMSFVLRSSAVSCYWQFGWLGISSNWYPAAWLLYLYILLLLQTFMALNWCFFSLRVRGDQPLCDKLMMWNSGRVEVVDQNSAWHGVDHSPWHCPFLYLQERPWRNKQVAHWRDSVHAN